MVLTLCHISGPLLSKCLRIYKILFDKRMEPFDSFFIAFLYRCIDHFSVICHCKVISGISITFPEAVDQDCRVLIAVVDNK